MQPYFDNENMIIEVDDVMLCRCFWKTEKL